jgi:hypothetical protein
VTVSQLTSLAVLGLDARRYLAALRADPSIPRRRIGSLVVSPVAAWMPSATPAQTSKAWSLADAVAKAIG